MGETPARGEFRFAYQAEDYEATLAFYEALGLQDLGRWDRGADDKGALFGAASGMIEILKLPADERFVAPQGAVLIEVDDVDAWHERARGAGIAVDQKPTDRPWGHRDLTVSDPNGLRLIFFSPA